MRRSSVLRCTISLLFRFRCVLSAVFPMPMLLFFHTCLSLTSTHSILSLTDGRLGKALGLLIFNCLFLSCFALPLTHFSALFFEQILLSKLYHCPTIRSLVCTLIFVPLQSFTLSSYCLCIVATNLPFTFVPYCSLAFPNLCLHSTALLSSFIVQSTHSHLVIDYLGS